MHLYRHYDDLGSDDRGCSVALGNFDGFHRGHQVVIGEAGRLARARDLNLSVFTTEPHPRTLFNPDGKPFRLTPFRERARLMEIFGVDVLACIHFDHAMAAMPAPDFVRDVLVDGLGARHVTVGYDYCFGAKRSGNAETLTMLGRDLGFAVQVIKPVSVGIEGSAGEIYSSTLVREALEIGYARRAAALLGHWFTVNGRVLHGDQRGRTIGFPTANVALEEESILPQFGVYAVRVLIEEEGERTVHEGVANLGIRPTFGKEDVLLEAFLFDFDGDLYDKHLRIELVGGIRAEKKFEGLDQLKAQIAEDSRVARQLLADPDNARDHLGHPTLERYLELFPEPLFVR